MFILTYLFPMWRSYFVYMISWTLKTFLMDTSLLSGIVSFIELWPPLVEFFLGGHCLTKKAYLDLFGPPFLLPPRPTSDW